MHSTKLMASVCALWFAGCGTDASGRDMTYSPGMGAVDVDGSSPSSPPAGGSGGSNMGGAGGSAGEPGPTNGGGGGNNAGPGPDDGTGMGDQAALRFVVLGDGGTGDAVQSKVAAAMKAVCADRGCEFALYLGDNIYENGADGVTDAQFKAKFEDPYLDLDFPFYVVLGNHDYGSNGTNFLPDDNKSATQVEYTGRSNKWNMPDYYYTFRRGPVAFFALDTNAIVVDRFRNKDTQQTWLDTELNNSDAPWKIVFGHHPYISNGEHGNAGSYVGSIGIELHDGSTFKSLVEESICGQAQVYFSGHDHDREWLEPTCGTSFIVSGAAAKLRVLEDRGSAFRFGDAEKNGFMWVEIDGDVLTGVFYDEDAKVSYEDTILRK